MKEVLTKIILVLVIIGLLAGIGYSIYGTYKKATWKPQNPIATMEVENYGTVKIELYPNEAPNTVSNFIRLANRGFYNGLNFHRTIPDFMIQGGGKTGNVEETLNLSDIMDNVEQDKAYNIPGEFAANGYTKNTIKHEKGVISMARSDYSNYGSSSVIVEGYNSAGSQFFIMTEDNGNLDGYYAAFGKVIEGMDVVEKISNTKVHYRDSELKEGEEAPKDADGTTIASDTPKKPPVITSLSVETFGIDYGIPETKDVFDIYSWMMQQYGATGY